MSKCKNRRRPSFTIIALWMVVTVQLTATGLFYVDYLVEMGQLNTYLVKQSTKTNDLHKRLKAIEGG